MNLFSNILENVLFNKIYFNSLNIVYDCEPNYKNIEMNLFGSLEMCKCKYFAIFLKNCF